MMDPVYFTVMLPVPKEDSECRKLGGDRTACLAELLGSNQVDLKNQLPADGLFTFTQRNAMDVWELKVNTGIGRGMLLVPKALADLAGPVLGLSIVTLIIGIVLTAGVCFACMKYAEFKQKSFLKQYIAQGLFLHDEEQNEHYDRIQQEEIMKEEGDAECFIQMDSDDEKSDSDDDDDAQSDAKIAKKRKERMDMRLIEAIGGEQGVLHFVTNQVTGTQGQQQMPAMSGSAMEAVGPTTVDLMLARAKTTLGHITLMALSTLPCVMLRFCFRVGIERFGYLGVDSGIIAAGVIQKTIQFTFVLSFVLFNIMLIGLALHYFFHEFDGKRFPWLRQFTRSKFAKWLLVQWTGFSYLQAACFSMSMFVIVIFLLNAAVGLILHFFTNMFAVTAIVGTGVAAYANFKSVEGVINLVMSEIGSAGTIMESVKSGLTQRIIELAVSEQQLVTDKRILRDRVIEKGHTVGEATSAWDPSVCSALPAGTLDEEDQLFLNDIEARQKKMTAGFCHADESGDGLLDREELELEFGKITDQEWAAFDANGDGDCSMQEWQDVKMKRVQKGVLIIRSAFEHCVEEELAKQGFDKALIIKYSAVGLVVIMAVLSLFYFAMDSANAFGAMAAVVSSGMSAAALAFMNQGKKKAGAIDPKIEKGIMQLNKALQITIKSAITDLTSMLRFFPVLLSIMEKQIDEAEKVLLEEYKEKPPKLKKNASDMVKIARDAFIAQKNKNFQMIVEANEIVLEEDGTHYIAWENLAVHGGGTVNGKKYSQADATKIGAEMRAKHFPRSQ